MVATDIEEAVVRRAVDDRRRFYGLIKGSVGIVQVYFDRNILTEDAVLAEFDRDSAFTHAAALPTYTQYDRAFRQRGRIVVPLQVGRRRYVLRLGRRTRLGLLALPTAVVLCKVGKETAFQQIPPSAWPTSCLALVLAVLFFVMPIWDEAQVIRELRERWLTAARAEVVEPGLLQTANRILGDAAEVLLIDRDAEGLKAASLHGPPIETASTRRILQTLNRTKGADIAIAGPRGAGKSTMIRWLVENTSGFGVVTSAPANYVPKEFLIALFADVCKKVLRDDGRSLVQRILDNSGRARRIVVAALFALIVWTSIAGTKGTVSFADLFGRLWKAWMGVQPVGFICLPIIAVGLLLWPPFILEGERARLRRELVTLARSHLEHLWFETTTSWTGEMNMLRAKIGGSAARKKLVWTTPELVGELRQFLEKLAAYYDRVTIGIDEVDRLSSLAEAEGFISEIKAVFRIDHCYFVVSVAEEVGSLFARRAMTGRSLFENAFEEVVSVEPLTPAEAQDVIQQRVKGFTTPFTHLVYALSGGVPRELLRLARRLIELNAMEGPPARLAELTRDLVRGEIQDALNGTRSQLAGLDQEDGMDDAFHNLRLVWRQLEDSSPQTVLTALHELAGVAPTSMRQTSPVADRAMIALSALAYFHLTTVEAFSRFHIDFVAVYRELAAAHRELSFSPAACRRTVDRCRRELSLRTIP